LGVCVERERVEVVQSTPVELENDTDSEDVDFAVIIGTGIKSCWDRADRSKLTGVVGSKHAGLVLSWLVRVELV